VITVKRLDSDYVSPKHISFIVTNSMYSPEDFRAHFFIMSVNAKAK